MSDSIESLCAEARRLLDRVCDTSGVGADLARAQVLASPAIVESLALIRDELKKKR